MNLLSKGKVREVYEVSNDKLVIVTTDRLSAYDVIIPKTVKDKGKVLNKLSLFWFDYTKSIASNHIISNNIYDMPKFFHKDEFKGRTVLVKRLKMLPYEFIVRGYMFGNMWAAYKEGKEFCGHKIVGSYDMAQKLESPLITPSIKRNEGHDEYVDYKFLEEDLGQDMAQKIKKICLKLYDECYRYAYDKGIIIADTKFEFGLDANNELVLADEIFTPDSSRFWSLENYKTGVSPESYDKQKVRDWLLNNKVDGKMQFDNVPQAIISETESIYRQCIDKLQIGDL